MYYCAGIYLDWSQYSLNEDGQLEGRVPAPTCPTCATELGVITPDEQKQTVLTAIARCLSLRDIASAERLYNTGLVRMKAEPVNVSRPGDNEHRGT